MSVDTSLITKLRDLTGAGIGDCRQALEEANNDIDLAVELMRKKGVMKAAKKSDRATKEGVIAVAKGEGKLAIFGIACETDFVSRNEDFIVAVNQLAADLLSSGDPEAFRVLAEERIKNELVLKIGENLQLAVCEIITGEQLGYYLHSNKKIASVVVMSGSSESVANELAMQVTAMSPRYVSPENVSDKEKEKEKEIYREQLKAENKPENMWDKISEGKLNKFYTEVCLLNQAFIKDDKISIEQYIKQQDSNAKVLDFKRFAI